MVVHHPSEGRSTGGFHGLRLGTIVFDSSPDLGLDVVKILVKHRLLWCSICLAMVVTSLGYLGNDRVAALMIPGTWVAIQFHTPDIHGGTRFIWTSVGVTFLIYFVVFWSMLVSLKSLGLSFTKSRGKERS
jgi:hypothetical protein